MDKSIAISDSTVYFNQPGENVSESLSTVLARIDHYYDMYSGDWRKVRALFYVNDDNEALQLLLRYPDFFQKFF